MRFPIPPQLSVFAEAASIDLTRYTNTKVTAHTPRVIGLLKMLGVPRQMLYVRRIRENGSFWQRNINHLEVLELARQLYRRQISFTHPDKPGGSLEQAVRLNVVWGKIQGHFKKHGHELW